MLTTADNQVYTGEFNQDLREGTGTLTVLGTNYKFESEFKEDKPVFTANKILFVVPKKVEEEEVKDTKGKAGAKGKKGAAEEEPVDENVNRLTYEF